MGDPADDLWRLTAGRPYVDAAALARAVERQAAQGTSDFRTQLLIRDSVRALTHHWGADRVGTWLRQSENGDQISQLCVIEDENGRGFPTLERRMVDAIDPNTVRAFLRDLSTHIQHPIRLYIGGAIALILDNRLSRHTDDIDVVDELPAEIRAQHALMDMLAKKYGLRMTHFQSHYLPEGWECRIHSRDVLGHLHVLTIDSYDIAVGKLFSSRVKDQTDLRELIRTLDKDAIERRLRESTAGLRSTKKLLDDARRNWFILFGEELPT